LLARAVAAVLNVPFRRLLRRHPGAAQTGRDALARHEGPGFEPRRRLAGSRVLLVDDVVTTGATVAAAARALREAGATTVHVVAAARTPPGRGHVHSAMVDRASQPETYLWK
ncbi:MAG: hypothetical protein JWM47_530, partial [Acidimicrobiales bacterium]|nr:hypothetical protein [Acidimicrobiales bacterium]